MECDLPKTLSVILMRRHLTKKGNRINELTISLGVVEKQTIEFDFRGKFWQVRRFCFGSVCLLTPVGPRGSSKIRVTSSSVKDMPNDNSKDLCSGFNLHYGPTQGF